MGVPGMQSFLKSNPSIAKHVDLNNISIVIDANNLLFYLFSKGATSVTSTEYRSDMYGGDMVAYGRAVSEFFDALDKCGITPILVHDGSSIGKRSTCDQVALKEKEIHRRGLERFQRTLNLTEGRPADGVTMPHILTSIFKSVANDKGVQRIQSPFEADSHIARIANELKCPVLTNDSDFIIYDLPVGFILIDSFEYKQLKRNANGSSSVSCDLYDQGALMRSSPGLRLDVLPLLSVLLGNDYSEQGNFDRVLDFCHGPYHGPFEVRSMNHRRIANMLAWLSRHDVESAIEYVIGQVAGPHRDKLRLTIKYLMRNYSIEAVDNFESEVQEVFPPELADPKLNIHPELLPPAYLRRLYEKKDLYAICLDMIFHNPYYNYPIIDDPQLVSNNYVKFRPISLAIALIRPKSYENLSSYRRKIQAERDAFYIFDRVKNPAQPGHNEYTRLIVRPMETLDNFGPLDQMNLYLTITCEPSLKKNILMSVFRFNVDEMSLMRDTVTRVLTGVFVFEATLCFMLVKYISLETNTPSKPQFVEALLLTLFYYATISDQIVSEVFEPSHYGRFLLKLRPHSRCNSKQVYSNEPSLYRRIMHFVSQLQSAYWAYNLINGLLNYVLEEPRCERFLNGPLIFRVTKLLRTKQLDIKDLCTGMPTLLEVCQSIKTQVHCVE